MREMIDSFLTWLVEKKNSSENTIMAYRNDLGQFWTFLTENSSAQSWADVTEGDILAYLRDIESREYAPATVARKMAAVRSFFHYLVLSEVLADDPTLAGGGQRAGAPFPITAFLTGSSAAAGQRHPPDTLGPARPGVDGVGGWRWAQDQPGGCPESPGPGAWAGGRHTGGAQPARAGAGGVPDSAGGGGSGPLPGQGLAAPGRCSPGGGSAQPAPVPERAREPAEPAGPVAGPERTRRRGRSGPRSFAPGAAWGVGARGIEASQGVRLSREAWLLHLQGREFV